jgi:IS5 family transposase
VIGAKNDEKLKLIMDALNIQDFEKKIARYKKYFGKDNRKKKKETERNTGIFRRKGRNNTESFGEGKEN